jgi:hypothetical protein
MVFAGVGMARCKALSWVPQPLLSSLTILRARQRSGNATLNVTSRLNTWAGYVIGPRIAGTMFAGVCRGCMLPLLSIPGVHSLSRRSSEFRKQPGDRCRSRFRDEPGSALERYIQYIGAGPCSRRLITLGRTLPTTSPGARGHRRLRRERGTTATSRPSATADDRRSADRPARDSSGRAEDADAGNSRGDPRYHFGFFVTVSSRITGSTVPRPTRISMTIATPSPPAHVVARVDCNAGLIALCVGAGSVSRPRTRAERSRSEDGPSGRRHVLSADRPIIGTGRRPASSADDAASAQRVW